MGKGFKTVNESAICSPSGLLLHCLLSFYFINEQFLFNAELLICPEPRLIRHPLCDSGKTESKKSGGKRFYVSYLSFES